MYISEVSKSKISDPKAQKMIILWTLKHVSAIREHPVWYNLQVYQECPWPPRLQEENWRTGGVLTWFLMSDHYETFTDSSDGCSLLSDPISRSIRNNHLLLDFRKRLGGQEKTWNDSWCQILIKFPIKTKLLPKPLV